MEEQRWSAFAYGRRRGARSLTPLTVHGIALEGDLAFSELPFRTIDRKERSLALKHRKRAAAGKIMKWPIGW